MDQTITNSQKKDIQKKYAKVRLFEQTKPFNTITL